MTLKGNIDFSRILCYGYEERYEFRSEVACYKCQDALQIFSLRT